MQVNNAKGEPLTKILSGETAAQAKKRISSEGILENSDGLALTDDDRITEEGAPYVFKAQQLQPQPQQDGELNCCSRILVFNVLFEYGNTSLFLY